jgi:energy-coupling factor transport system ATP-binding protein
MHLMLEYTGRAIVISDSKKIADQKSFEVLCDRELVDAANLKETSLFDLALKADISDPLGFVECFINYDREVREHEA